MEEKKMWIVGECSSAGDAIGFRKFYGNKEEVKKFLMNLIICEREVEEASEVFEYGTESEDDLTVRYDGSIYGYNCFVDSHTDFEATPENTLTIDDLSTLKA